MTRLWAANESLDSRKFAYNELGEDEPIVVSEDYIRERYWPYWQEQMLAARARGQPNAFNTEINWDNCLEDWIVINWAWEVSDVVD